MKKTLLIILSCLLSGCAAQSNNMIVSHCKISNKHPYTVSVKVFGGRETNPLWTSQISNSALCSAIEKSILESGLFEAISTKKAGYKLEVAIERITQPVIGLDFKMVMLAKWTLTERAQQKIIWSDSIKSRYTAKLGDAFVAAERIQKANEGVARENIKKGIYELSLLQL